MILSDLNDLNDLLDTLVLDKLVMNLGLFFEIQEHVVFLYFYRSFDHFLQFMNRTEIWKSETIMKFSKIPK